MSDMSEGAARPLLVLSGRGHSAVRATHAKTIEFTPAASLGAGGTCIVAVSSSVSGAPAAGMVELEIATGSIRCVFTARANPDWDPAGPAVIRKSDVRRPDTLATHASLGARDLPNELRSALAVPNAEVTLTVRRGAESGLHVVLVSGSPSAAERAAADLEVSGGDDVEPPLRGRVLVVGDSIPRRLLSAADRTLEVYGLTPERAVAVPSASASTTTAEAPEVADPELRGSALVVRVATRELPRVIRSAQRNGRQTGALLGHLPWVPFGRLSDLVPPPGTRSVWLYLDPAERPATDAELLARIVELRGDGVSTKALAKEVAREFGVPANRVYTLALSASPSPRPTSHK